MKSLVLISNEKDMKLIKEILFPYKFLELHYHKYLPKQKYDLIITNKPTIVLNTHVPAILINCKKEQQKANIFMCKSINKDIIDFIIDINEKDNYYKYDQNSQKKYIFSEKFLDHKKKLFFNYDYEKIRNYFSTFNNMKLLEVIDYFYKANVSLFTCEVKKKQITFYLHIIPDYFIINNYFESFIVRNKICNLIFKL